MPRQCCGGVRCIPACDALTAPALLRTAAASAGAAVVAPFAMDFPEFGGSDNTVSTADESFGDNAVNAIEAMLRREQEAAAARINRVGALDDDDDDSDDYSEDFDTASQVSSARPTARSRAAADRGRGEASARRSVVTDIDSDAYSTDSDQRSPRPAVEVPTLLMGSQGPVVPEDPTVHYPPVVPHDAPAPQVHAQRPGLDGPEALTPTSAQVEDEPSASGGRHDDVGAQSKPPAYSRRGTNGTDATRRSPRDNGSSARGSARGSANGASARSGSTSSHRRKPGGVNGGDVVTTTTTTVHTTHSSRTASSQPAVPSIDIPTRRRESKPRARGGGGRKSRSRSRSRGRQPTPQNPAQDTSPSGGGVPRHSAVRSGRRRSQGQTVPPKRGPSPGARRRAAEQRRAATLQQLREENKTLRNQVTALRSRLEAAKLAARKREARKRREAQKAAEKSAADEDDSSEIELQLKLDDLEAALDVANQQTLEAASENIELKHQADAGERTSIVHQVKEEMSRIRLLDKKIERLQVDNQALSDINKHQELSLNNALQHAHALKHQQVTAEIRELHDESTCTCVGVCAGV